MSRPKKPGAPKLLADPKEVKELAALGMNKLHIAAGLGFSRATLNRRLEDTPELLEAYETGRFEYRKDVLARYKKHAGNTIPGLIFEVKNALGWTDQRTVDHTGSIEVVIREIILDEAIDITPARLGESSGGEI